MVLIVLTCIWSLAIRVGSWCAETLSSGLTPGGPRRDAARARTEGPKAGEIFYPKALPPGPPKQV